MSFISRTFDPFFSIYELFLRETVPKDAFVAVNVYSVILYKSKSCNYLHIVGESGRFINCHFKV